MLPPPHSQGFLQLQPAWEGGTWLQVPPSLPVGVRACLRARDCCGWGVCVSCVPCVPSVCPSWAWVCLLAHVRVSRDLAAAGPSCVHVCLLMYVSGNAWGPARPRGSLAEGAGAWGGLKAYKVVAPVMALAQSSTCLSLLHRMTVWLSTAPTEPLTHWYQVRCLFQSPLFAKAGDTLSGTCLLIANKRCDCSLGLVVGGRGPSAQPLTPRPAPSPQTELRHQYCGPGGPDRL